MQNIPKYYSAINKNEHEREKSTSGAIFPLLAKRIIKENGVVCGVAYDDNMVVKHMIATTEDEIEKFKGSKYVYSNIGGIFIEIKKILKSR